MPKYPMARPSTALKPPLRGEPSKEPEKQKKTADSFLVAYELEHSQDYGGLSSVLKQMEGVEVLRSVWLVKNYGGDPDEIREKLLPRLSPSDRLFVIRFRRRDFAYHNLICGDLRAKGI